MFPHASYSPLKKYCTVIINWVVITSHYLPAVHRDTRRISQWALKKIPIDLRVVSLLSWKIKVELQSFHNIGLLCLQKCYISKANAIRSTKESFLIWREGEKKEKGTIATMEQIKTQIQGLNGFVICSCFALQRGLYPLPFVDFPMSLSRFAGHSSQI